MTTVLTGRDVTLTIAEDTYDEQCKGATLTIEHDRQEHETLAGRRYKQVDEIGTLEVTILTDWGVTGGLCAAMWEAADTAPDDGIGFSMSVNGDVFAGSVLPIKPPSGGQGKDASEVTLSLTCLDVPTRTAASVGG